MSDLIARQTRADNLQASRETAEKARILLEPDFKRLLDAEDASLVEKLLSASNDAERRERAAEVRAWRRLRTIITSTAATGSYASKKLKEMRNV